MMSTHDLAGDVVRLERDLSEARTRLARATADPIVISCELSASREYAFDANTPGDELTADCLQALDRYGFCAIENVICDEQVAEVREEVIAADQGSNENRERRRAAPGAEAWPPAQAALRHHLDAAASAVHGALVVIGGSAAQA